MNPLRTTVLMKTDISGSTSRFRELLAADLQALLGEHRDFLARHAAKHDGHIIKDAGDGHWLEFSGVTGAAKAAIEMQEELRLAQPNRGDDRIAIRIVIAVGDIAVQYGDFIGDAFALATRVEAVTPPDEIYLTAAARFALNAAEIQTALVESFAFKGFSEPLPVYRIEQRHRTRTITDAFILFSDLSGFGRMMDAGPASATVERILDTLDALARGSAQERYRALQSRRFLLRDVRRGHAGHCMGRAFDPELGSNSAPGTIRLHDQHRAAPWNALHVPFFSLRPGRLDRLATAECIG
jgi:class 3 adenylate cyclase